MRVAVLPATVAKSSAHRDRDLEEYLPRGTQCYIVITVGRVREEQGRVCWSVVKNESGGTMRKSAARHAFQAFQPSGPRYNLDQPTRNRYGAIENLRLQDGTSSPIRCILVRLDRDSVVEDDTKRIYKVTNTSGKLADTNDRLSNRRHLRDHRRDEELTGRSVGELYCISESSRVYGL